MASFYGAQLCLATLHLQGSVDVTARNLKTELVFVQLLCEGHNLDVQVRVLCPYSFKLK